MIGIIGAMQEEVAAIKDFLEIHEEKTILDCTFYQGTMANKEVVLLQGGIGKVNAAICTTLLLTNFPIDYVINIGSAGGLSLNQEVGDIIISNEVCQHDFDITAFPNRIIGEVPGLPARVPANKDLIATAKNILKELNQRCETGLIVSGDQFIAKEAQVDTIKKNFSDAKCAEMEAAAVGQTCYKFNVPFIITRSLSDVYGKGDSSIQFDEYLKKAASTSAEFCFTLVKEHK